VALEEGAGLQVDAREFAEAVADKDHERAAALYGGAFLDGIYIAGSATFEQWVTRERTRLETLFLQTCERQCMALARARRWEECGALAARWLDAAPLSADAALFRLNALKAPGTRDADQRALAEFERIAARLSRDFDLAPEKSVVALANDIATRLATTGATTAEVRRPTAIAATAMSPGRPSAASAPDLATVASPTATVATPPSSGVVAAPGATPATGGPSSPPGRSGAQGGGPPPVVEGSAPAAAEPHRRDAGAIEPSRGAPPPHGESAPGSPIGPHHAGADTIDSLALAVGDDRTHAPAQSGGGWSVAGALLGRRSSGGAARPSDAGAGAIPGFRVPATTEEFRALGTEEIRALRASLATPARGVPRHQPRRWWIGGLVAAVLLVAVGIGAAYVRDSRSAVADGRPAIAIADIHTLRGDTSTAWMAEGLAQMIASKLARSTSVDVISPERVRVAKVRAGLDRRAELAEDEALDLGRRLGATWVVSGGITGRDSALVFVITVREVASGKVLQPDAVTGSNILVLADAAASRLLDAAGAQAAGPRLADVETSSVEAAEHFSRGMLAFAGGLGAQAQREMDAAIALDSGFISAIRMRMGIAEGQGDTIMARRLDSLFERHKGRATEWDRRYHQLRDEWIGGSPDRAESMARELVQRFPRDPRGYGQLAEILMARGKWDEAERVLMQEMALDSLAAEAGSGACAVCGANQGLVFVRWLRGDLAGAERASRRWLELQPEHPLAWEQLAATLAYQGRFEAALEANRRALVLSGGEAAYEVGLGRTLVMMRDHEGADSVARAMLRRREPSSRTAAYDLRVVVARERGQLRAANRMMEEYQAENPGMTMFFDLVRGNNLGRLGDYAGAERVYERATHMPQHPSPLRFPLSPGMSRSYSWHHALLADAIGPSGDTVRLRALADSLVLFASGSYYGRDWRLTHHVRGLVAMHGRRYEEAVREFRAAMWGPYGWTRSNVEMARALRALGRPRDAIAVLRDAYAAPLDAMGRYQPRSELDLLMALAFRDVGEQDSATVYGAHARRAWRDADPEVARMLEMLMR
jgi:DNA-binding SARP family transcriptional activator/TolB-like protein